MEIWCEEGIPEGRRAGGGSRGAPASLVQKPPEIQPGADHHGDNQPGRRWELSVGVARSFSRAGIEASWVLLCLSRAADVQAGNKEITV